MSGTALTFGSRKSGHSVRIPPAEFPVVVDRVSYVIPTFGIAAIACTVAAIIASGVGIAIGARIPLEDRVAWEDAAFFTWILSAGVIGAGWWLRRRWRIHHERKLVVDREGITYVAFAGQAHLMRWTDIVGVEEKEEYGPDEGMSLIYRLEGGTFGYRKFIVRNGDFHGYAELRQLTLAYLPSRTVVHPRG
jgi:hypothetical protein